MTPDRHKPLLDREFLRAELHYEYQDYEASGDDEPLRLRLADWAKRQVKRETQAEAAFTDLFFVDLWGYRYDKGQSGGFELFPKFAIAGSGQTGNRGEADLAVGLFGDGRAAIPQVVCEFKDVRSGLDAPQPRKGNTRSPVMQARDYLWNARRGLFGNEPVQPRYAIVTDMNEFRLYWWDGFPDRYLRFKVEGGDLFAPHTLTGADAEARFDRFLFARLFRPDMLLSAAGRTRLERLIEKQGVIEKKLEEGFYDHYRAYREVLIRQIMLQRLGLEKRGVALTRSGAVRLGQKLLDRLIFVMFAEDMGWRVGFPPSALSDELKRQSGDQFLEPEGDEVWRRLKQIFRVMNAGGRLGNADIHEFNGGLFRDDPALDALELPNHLFVRFGQGVNEAMLHEHKETLFFLASRYNFSREGDARNSIGLYTLGHIFEQSIVELEKLEADAEGRPSLTDVTKRKRDGVYYTPEWVVRRIIEEVVDPLLARWKREAGWPTPGVSTSLDTNGEGRLVTNGGGDDRDHPPSVRFERSRETRPGRSADARSRRRLLEPPPADQGRRSRLRVGRVPDRGAVLPPGRIHRRDGGGLCGGRDRPAAGRGGDHGGDPHRQSMGRRHQPRLRRDHAAVALAPHRAGEPAPVVARPQRRLRQQPGRPPLLRSPDAPRRGGARPDQHL